MKNIKKQLTPHISVSISTSIFFLILFFSTSVFAQCSSATAVTAIDVIKNEDGSCDFTINLNYTNSSGSGNSSILVDIYLSDGTSIISNECITNISGPGVAVYGPFTNIDCSEILIVDWVGKTNPTCGGSSCDFGSFSSETPISLPIELLSFDVESMTDNILLSWATLTELNADYFSIMHSIDGENFVEISRIRAEGNSNELRFYNFVHNEASRDANYYKLIQYDIDGMIGYISDVKIGSLDVEINKMLVYPSTFENSITIEFDKRIERERIIELYSVSGNLIKRSIFEEGDYNHELNLQDIVPGSYFLILYDDVFRDVRRVIKIRD